jgi:hypothetical protein
MAKLKLGQRICQHVTEHCGDLWCYCGGFHLFHSSLCYERLSKASNFLDASLDCNDF